MERFRKIGIELRIEAEYLNLEKQGIKIIQIFILAAILHTRARTHSHTHTHTHIYIYIYTHIHMIHFTTLSVFTYISVFYTTWRPAVLW